MPVLVTLATEFQTYTTGTQQWTYHHALIDQLRAALEKGAVRGAELVAKTVAGLVLAGAWVAFFYAISHTG